MVFKSEIRNYIKFDEKKHFLVMVGFEEINPLTKKLGVKRDILHMMGFEENLEYTSQIQRTLKTRTKDKISYISIDSSRMLDYFLKNDFSDNLDKTPYLIVSDMHLNNIKIWHRYVGLDCNYVSHISQRKLNKLSEKLDCNLLYGKMNFFETLNKRESLSNSIKQLKKSSKPGHKRHLDKLIANNKDIHQDKHSLNEFMPPIEDILNGKFGYLKTKFYL